MKSRMDFLDFALSHCPPEEIGALLEERGALEARVCEIRSRIVSSLLWGGEGGGGGGGGCCGVTNMC